MKHFKTIIIVFLILLPALSLLRYSKTHQVVHRQTVEKKVYAEAPTSKAEELSPPPTGQELIESYIGTIFGNNAGVAIAVQHAECSPQNRNYPHCIYITSQEYSCGIFQINLRAHWNKVPVGTTFEEKCAYLNDPYNNILIAHKIFSESGFYPWSAFTSGRYLKEL